MLLELEHAPHVRLVPGVVQDLNHDGQPDYLLQGASSLCGNGGCPYAIVDGAGWVLLGVLLGSAVVVRERSINGWPVLEAYAHMSAMEGNYTSYVFDGQVYRKVSTLLVMGQTRDTLFARLQRLLRVPARGHR